VYFVEIWYGRLSLICISLFFFNKLNKPKKMLLVTFYIIPQFCFYLTLFCLEWFLA
jgi:hypothetical protein